MAPISLTLEFDTEEQAHHVLEAYREARTWKNPNSEPVPYPVGNAPAYDPGPVPSAPPVSYPLSGPTHDPQSAPAATEVDERGVPWHPDHHSSSKKQSKGKWDRRRGHNKAAADAYEEPFTRAQQTQQAAAQVAAMMPPAMPPQTMGPSAQELRDLWSELCMYNRVTMEHHDFIVRTWGAHPASDEIVNDHTKRAAVWAYLQAFRA
jgi:hypothetical protein